MDTVIIKVTNLNAGSSQVGSLLSQPGGEVPKPLELALKKNLVEPVDICWRSSRLL